VEDLADAERAREVAAVVATDEEPTGGGAAMMADVFAKGLGGLGWVRPRPVEGTRGVHALEKLALVGG
jgi:hypothetical protein